MIDKYNDNFDLSIFKRYLEVRKIGLRGGQGDSRKNRMPKILILCIKECIIIHIKEVTL
jgi:hypothetical protein